MAFDGTKKLANRYGLNLYFYKYGQADAAPCAVIDFANEVAIELSTDLVWATGGQGFKKMVGFKNPFEGTLTITTQITNNTLLSLLSGGDGELVNGKAIFSDTDKQNNYFVIKGYTSYKAEDGTVAYEEITAHKAMVAPGFSTSYTGDGDPQSIDIEFQLAADSDNNVLTLWRDGENMEPKSTPVEPEQPAPVAVTGVSLDQTTLEMTVGDADVTLVATIEPADAANKDVTWASDDDGVASVADGVVTAVGAGNATITVKTNDGGYTATCNVTVTAA